MVRGDEAAVRSQRSTGEDDYGRMEVMPVYAIILETTMPGIGCRSQPNLPSTVSLTRNEPLQAEEYP